MPKAPRYLVSNGLVIGRGARDAFDLNNLHVVLASDYDDLARIIHDKVMQDNEKIAQLKRMTAKPKGDGNG